MTSAAPANGEAARGPSRTRLWLCAVLVGLVVGLVSPPEAGLRAFWAKVRTHAVKSHVAVVAIDDKSIADIGRWPFPRSTYAELTDRLFEMGAKRVFFVINFSSASTADEDRAFIDALDRHRGRAYLATQIVQDENGHFRFIQPIAPLAAAARLANIEYFNNEDGSVSALPYSVMFDGKLSRGIASLVAGKSKPDQSTFPIDRSIDLSSIPVTSVSDVLHSSGRLPAIVGKDVLVGATSNQLQDVVLVRPYGQIAATTLLAIGAETLFEGVPQDYGWLPAFALASGLLPLLLRSSRRRDRIVLSLLLAGMLPFLPALLPTYKQLLILPGFAVLGVAAAVEGWKLLRDVLRERTTTNQISGLLNLVALRQLAPQTDRRLVVARVHNFAEVTAALPPEDEAVLVTQIATRLKLGTTGADLYNGDNGVFAWLATDDVATLGERLDALHALFRSPVTVSAQNVDLNVTFGFDDDDERSIANRLGSALVAAAEAHAEGAKWRQFDKAKLADAAWKLSLLSQLDAAIDDGQLWVAYQPKLDLASRRIVGAEALVRWTHPEKGAISPIEFVAAAEQHNRIEKLTMHVLDRAVLACATINAHGIAFGIAVNLSTRLLETRDIVDAVAATLAEHRLDASKLTLEITETATLTSATSLDVLAELRALGLRISIDDYGTGLSTLDYLKKIPASEIKIDRSFVQSMLSGGSDLLMVNSTIQLAHSLGHVVVAEGVETDEVLARLADLQCDIAQGYRIGRPMMFQDLARRLLAERRRAA